MAQIELLLAESQPHMLFCTEARVTIEINDAEISVDGYKTMRSDSVSRHSGGVILYYRCDMNVVKLANHVLGYNNILVIDVLSDYCRGVWVGVYHSPGSSDAEFLNEFELIIESLVSISKPLTIAGDFNINVHRSSQSNTYKQRLKRFEHSHSLKQLITDFTRITATSRTTVDLGFTNNHMISAAV